MCIRDRGWKDLSERVGINGDKLAKYTHIGANVDGESPELAPSYVKDVDGVKVAFVGGITESLPTLVSPAGIAGITVSDPIDAMNKEADRLVAAGEADVVIGLLHEDVATQPDTQLSRFSRNIAAVAGGHSHLYAQKTVARDGALPLVVIQAENYGTAVGDIDISYDKAAKKLVSITGAVQDMKEINKDTDCITNPDPELKQIVSDAKAKAEVLGLSLIHISEPTRPY